MQLGVVIRLDQAVEAIIAKLVVAQIEHFQFFETCRLRQHLSACLRYEI